MVAKEVTCRECGVILSKIYKTECPVCGLSDEEMPGDESFSKKHR